MPFVATGGHIKISHRLREGKGERNGKGGESIVLVEKLQTQERREVGYVKRTHENDGFHNYSTRSKVSKVLNTVS